MINSHDHTHSHSHDHGHQCDHSSKFASALLPGLDNEKLLGKNDKIVASQRRIVDLTQKISRVETNLKALDNNQSRDPGDWTQSYQYWNKWDDVEDLKQQATNEQSNLEAMYGKANMMGHCHDHGEVLSCRIRINDAVILIL